MVAIKVFFPLDSEPSFSIYVARSSVFQREKAFMMMQFELQMKKQTKFLLVLFAIVGFTILGMLTIAEKYLITKYRNEYGSSARQALPGDWTGTTIALSRVSMFGPNGLAI